MFVEKVVLKEKLQINSSGEIKPLKWTDNSVSKFNFGFGDDV
jgi:hypothetical protein